jgi:hypothetical protein
MSKDQCGYSSNSGDSLKGLSMTKFKQMEKIEHWIIIHGIKNNSWIYSDTDEDQKR